MIIDHLYRQRIRQKIHTRNILAPSLASQEVIASEYTPSPIKEVVDTGRQLIPPTSQIRI
jgi:hypothetical protein